ncbi:hypothetical protein EGW08_003534 [Elysia chlorotica]|uniref:Uncharacterized protein n=1 Tax=Elysia chlorotica TaxID=188477 RepID=A0A433U4G8_ELYCH|nr:hypothetical protein EGW08_003534 [Elysia chlorotica]
MHAKQLLFHLGVFPVSSNMGAEGEGKAPTVYIETLLVVRPIKVVGLMCGIIAVLLLLLSIAATSWLQAERTREGLWEKCVYNVTNSDYLDECELTDDTRGEIPG